jgi:hypothetical protein
MKSSHTEKQMDSTTTTRDHRSKTVAPPRCLLYRATELMLDTQHAGTGNRSSYDSHPVLVVRRFAAATAGAF